MKKLLYLFLVLGLMMTGCIGYSRHETMRAGLDSINERNRNDLPFTVSDVQPYVDYFDDNGSPNDRLLVHYLLGRAYYEQGESPMALQCYQDALDFADTTETDCDFAQLSRVYGQMGWLFYEQSLYRQYLIYENYARTCAWKAKDTLTSLIYYEQQKIAYDELGMLDSAIFVIENVSRLYDKYGYHSDAAIALGSIARNLLIKGNIEKAHEYMQKYEMESGLFGQNGKIQEGREAYYNTKGLFHFKKNQLDSAAYWYRKELTDGKDFNNQNGGAFGLAMVFEQRHMPDSAAKYYQYAYAMNDSMYAQMATETISRTQALYNYSRHQQIAEKEARNAERARHYVFVISLCCIVLFVCLYAAYARYKRNKHVEIKHIKEQYESDVEKLEQAKYDLMKMQEKEITHLIEEKAKDICQLQQQIGQYEQALSSIKTVQQLEHHLEANGSYARFRYLSSHPSEKPTEEDWQLLRTMTDELLPDFKTTIYGAAPGLKQADYDICLLVRLYFSPSEVAMLTDNALSAITMKRRRLLERLFHQTGKAETFDRLIRQIR